jgi:pilus assembly protein CpaF
MSGEEVANPFAPTPLGKNWTPPNSPARTDAETNQTDVSGAAALDDLFEVVDAAGEYAPLDTADSGLDDLFETPVTAVDAPETSAGDESASLDGLFEVSGGATAEQTPVTKPRVRRRGVPAALIAKNRVVTAEEDAGTGNRESDTTQARAPLPPMPEKRHRSATAETAAKPANQTGEVSAARNHAGDARVVDNSAETLTAAPVNATFAEPVPLRAEVARADAARANSSQPDAPRRRSLFEYGSEEIARAWTIVDQTLAIVASDITLQQVTSGITLTADPAEYDARRAELHAVLRRKMASAGIAPSGLIDSETILDLAVDEMSGISVLGELFRDPGIDEILVDRWDIISVERHGNLERTSIRFRDPQHAESCARVLALKISDRAVSRAIPLVTAELPSARITFAFGAVVKGGLSITIRKFRPLLGLTDLLEYGSLNRDMVEFLRTAVKARAGILVSGGTGTGKTTIVNLLSSFIPDTERVVSIEDAFELKLANTHVVSLQTKEASSLDDTVSVTLAELLRNTLRMRPDRIIVGEIREGAGAMVMLSAASTGHDGTLTTVHANSAEAAVNERLPDLVRQSLGGLATETILRSVANAFDLVIHVSRTRDGRRYLSQVSALDGISDGRIMLQPVFIGTETPNGISFQQHALGADTELARRLAERQAGGEEN